MASFRSYGSSRADTPIEKMKFGKRASETANATQTRQAERDSLGSFLSLSLSLYLLSPRMSAHRFSIRRLPEPRAVDAPLGALRSDTAGIAPRTADRKRDNPMQNRRP